MQYFVFATERSGSTFLTSWLDSYLRAHHGYAGCAWELFNMHYNYRFENGTLEVTDSSDQYASAMQRREWLQQAGRVLVKHFPVFNNPKADSLLFNTRTPICLYRRDRWQQILSYGLAKATLVFNRRPNTVYVPPTITYDRFLFDAIVAQIRAYDERVVQLDQCVEISYEEFVSDQDSLLQRLPLQPKHHSFVPPVSPLNVHDKELSYTNIDEVRAWYRSIAASLSR